MNTSTEAGMYGAHKREECFIRTEITEEITETKIDFTVEILIMSAH